ncbi:tail fiber protein [Azospirillum argentinense]
MTTTIVPVITNAGRQKVINVTASGFGPAVISHVGFGSAAYTPAATATALQAERRRVPATGGAAVAPHLVHVTAIDDGDTAYEIRELGFFLDDGTLFAVYSHPSAKLADKVAGVDFMLAFDLAVQSLPAGSLTVTPAALFHLPPATETVMGVAEIATQGETDAGIDDERVITPKKLAGRSAPGATPNTLALRDAAGTLTATTMEVRSASPSFQLLETDGAANAKQWYMAANGGVLNFGMNNDAQSASNIWLQVQRSGHLPVSATFMAPIVAPAITSSGNITVAGASNPRIVLNETDGAANAKRWSLWLSDDGLNDLVLGTQNDSGVDRGRLTMKRSGETWLDGTFNIYGTTGNTPSLRFSTDSASDFAYIQSGNSGNDNGKLRIAKWQTTTTPIDVLETYAATTRFYATNIYFNTGGTDKIIISETGIESPAAVTVTNGNEWPIVIRGDRVNPTSRYGLLVQRSLNGGAVTTNTRIGSVDFGGYDGTTYSSGWNGGASIIAEATQNWTQYARGARLAFYTTPNNTVSQGGPAMIIESESSVRFAAGVSIGTAATGQFPTQLTISDSNHATSRHAKVLIGSGWALSQDYNGNGTKNFGFYNNISSTYVYTISTGSIFDFKNTPTVAGKAVWNAGNCAVTGAVLYFATSTTPAGFLRANGAAISRTTYADLFAVIGTTFGAGDGSTTFNLPDLRAEFVRGWDDGRFLDPNRAFGSVQTENVRGPSGGGNLVSQSSEAVWLARGTDVWGTLPGGLLAFGTSPNDTRPHNIALLACIKY